MTLEDMEYELEGVEVNMDEEKPYVETKDLTCQY